MAQRLLALGVVVTLAFSVGVMATGPIYADGAREFITASSLVTASAPVVNIRVGLFAVPSFDLAEADRDVRSYASGLPVEKIITQGDASVDIGPSNVSVPLVFRDGQDEHILFKSGRPPGPGEIALPFGLSWSSGFRTGDRVTVFGAKRTRATLKISGVFDPPEPDDYWFGSETPFPVGEAITPVPAVIEPRFARGLVARLHLAIQFDWDIYVARTGMDFEQARRLPADYFGFRNDIYRHIEVQQVVVDSGIPSLIAEVERDVRDLQIPILLVLLQILVVTLVVLAGVGVLLVARQSFELAILHSRGVSTGSLLRMQSLQAFLAAALAWPIGIGVAVLLARFAAFTNRLRAAGVGFPVRTSAPALLLGAGAALAGAVVLTVPSVTVVRRTVVDERRQSSRETKPMLARVPVELIVLPVGLFALAQLHNAGEAAPVGAPPLDPLLLFGPTFVILGASFLIVRILSAVLGALDGRIGRCRRLSSYLAGRRLARAPGVAFASAVLLVLSIGLLFISTSYRATTLQNHADAAHAFVGTDWLASVGAASGDATEAVAQLPSGMSAVARIQPSGFRGSYSTRPDGLVVDPSTFGAAAWWRSDFAGEPLDAMLDALRAPSVGVPLPDGAQQLSVRVHVPQEAARMTIQASFATADGTVLATVPMTLAPGSAVYPMDVRGGRRLLSLTVDPATSTALPPVVPLFIRDVRLDGGDVSLDGWVPLRVRGASGRLRPQTSGWLFMAKPGLGTGPMGLEPKPPPIPVIVSQDIAANERRTMLLRLGDQTLAVQRVATATSFPSVAPRDPFIVFPTPTLFDLVHAVPGALAAPTEVWVRGRGAPTEVIEKAGFPVGNTLSARVIETQLAKNPQSLAVGLDAAAAIAGLGLVIAGVTATLYFAQRRRDFEFASLRAIGAASPSLRATIAKEQIVLIGAASLAGLLVGSTVLRLATAPLLKTFGASFPRPVVVIDVRALILALIVIAIATTLAVAAATRALLRSSISAVLRGEPE